MKEDFFFDETCDKLLQEEEQMVWRGYARAVIPRHLLVISGFVGAFGVALGVWSNAYFPANDFSEGFTGSFFVAFAFLLLFLAVIPQIRMLSRLRKVRYVITTQRALILDGVVELPGGSLASDLVTVRSIPPDTLAKRSQPSVDGTIWMGEDKRTIVTEKLLIRYGFYACSEPEGAEMEIRRLLGELPLVPEIAEAG